MTEAQGRHWNLGRHYLAVGRHDRAIEELRSLLALDPELLPGHLALVSALNKAGDKSRALEEATRLAASHPQSALLAGVFESGSPRRAKRDRNRPAIAAGRGLSAYAAGRAT